MEKRFCITCDCMHDLSVGEEEGGIEPGIAFEDLPEDWVCPVYGVDKDEFEKVK